MNDPELMLPRRLAIELLAQAQRLEPGAGLEGYLEGTLDSLKFVAGEPPEGVDAWALVRTEGTALPASSPPPRLLTVALDTKGVLQLRCWDTHVNPPVERTLRIR